MRILLEDGMSGFKGATLVDGFMRQLARRPSREVRGAGIALRPEA